MTFVLDVLVSFGRPLPGVESIDRRMMTLFFSVSMSPHRRPAISPRRQPVQIANCSTDANSGVAIRIARSMTIGVGTVGSRLGTDGACIRRKGFISM